MENLNSAAWLISVAKRSIPAWLKLWSLFIYVSQWSHESLHGEQSKIVEAGVTNWLTVVADAQSNSVQAFKAEYQRIYQSTNYVIGSINQSINLSITHMIIDQSTTQYNTGQSIRQSIINRLIIEWTNKWINEWMTEKKCCRHFTPVTLPEHSPMKTYSQPRKFPSIRQLSITDHRQLVNNDDNDDDDNDE